ncbi:MAG TPA: hypothetical protein VIF82_14975 [Burkholderiaceae bacterium]
MSILTLAYPAQAAVSVAQTFAGFFAGALRSALGIAAFGLIAIFAMVFKPLIIGVLRAGRLVIQPRVSAQQRQLLLKLEGVQLLNKLAKDADATQPNLAAEMRYLAARG